MTRYRGPDGLNPRSVNLLSIHACPWSSLIREDEARWLTLWAHPGMLTLAAGLWNDVPAGTDPDWSRNTDSALYVQRHHLSDDGRRWRNDDRADRTLTAAGYVDAAAWSAQRHGRGHLALAPTSGRDSRLPMRDVRAYVTEELTQAVARVRVGEPAVTPTHRPLVIDLDPDTLHQITTSLPATTVV